MTIGQPNIHLTTGKILKRRFKKGCFYRSYGIQLFSNSFSKKSTNLLIFFMYFDEKISKKVKKVTKIVISKKVEIIV
jgi:hypothetical protein